MIYALSKSSNCDDLGCIYFEVICRLQSLSNGMIHSCKISTDKRVAWSLCNSTANWSYPLVFICRILDHSFGMQVAKAPTYLVICQFPLFVALRHTIHQCYRQTNGQTDRSHAHCISAIAFIAYLVNNSWYLWFITYRCQIMLLVTFFKHNRWQQVCVRYVLS